MKAKGAKKNGTFLFLTPFIAIKHLHLSKKDVKTVRSYLAMKMGAIAFVVAILLLFVSFGMWLGYNLHSNWDLPGMFGIESAYGLGCTAFGCVTTIVLFSIALKVKRRETKALLARIAVDVLHLAISSTMLLYVLADSKSGFLVGTEVLSPSVILLVVLCLLQPAYYADGIILDVGCAVGLIAVAVRCHMLFNLGSLYYYILLGACFPIVAYLVSSVMLYAEIQNYCQIQTNERLTNTILYDELTKCKSRSALTQFIAENEKRWRTRDVRLMIIMFDVDDFKEFNDQFSHPVGDYCLRRISDAIRTAFPSPGLDFYRYGGEEFLLFFELREDSDPSDILLQLREAVISANIQAPEGAPRKVVTISIGAKLFHTFEVFDYKSDLLEVDHYLYQAKSAGKDIAVLNGRIVK